MNESISDLICAFGLDGETIVVFNLVNDNGVWCPVFWYIFARLQAPYSGKWQGPLS
jgi:hypothetical protein